MTELTERIVNDASRSLGHQLFPLSILPERKRQSLTPR